ncbi:sialate O-acetylesterase [Patella vulgata]|uniref:sialate O-acetylesterase n=1 Tax=Patella vulgata TaxID=6465 RepID=UPI0024A9C7F9|nr:sialate O-acetylesterase [Patella vulgata]
MVLITLILLVTAVTGSDAALRFSASYGDHVVLQRGPHKAVVWGYADKNNENVTIQIVGHGSPVQTTTANGMWKAKLPAMTSPGPFVITATSSEGSVSLHDVLFGDVWVCSGQSNMVFAMNSVNNSAYELKKALTFDKIRLFHVKDVESPTPLADIKTVQTPWTAPTAESVPAFSALCLLYGEYLYNHRKYPIGLIESAWGGTPIEAWSGPDAIKACTGHARKRNHRDTSVLWNAMINPLLATTIYGAIWFQGEANARHSAKYACQQPAMVKEWRKNFHHASMGETSLNFPFGFVQLAANSANHTKIGGFPGLRWAQTANMGYVPNTKIPHSFMSVAMDLPDFHSPRGSIHSRFKQDVAERLGLASLAVAYGEKGLSYQGPYPTSFNTKTKGHLVIEYDHGHTVLDIRTTAGFEICCSATSQTTCGTNDAWVAAPVLTHHGATVTLNVSGCQDKHWVGLRYSWRESPCEFKKCCVYGRDNDLPAPSFIRNTAF